MSADGDFIRECRWQAERLLAAVEDWEHTFTELPDLFQQAADHVAEMNRERIRWLG
jgi:hypothetical protein